MIRDAVGNLYGTTGGGGSSRNWGVVFKLGLLGNETVLHNFTGGADGGGPAAGLVRDAVDNLYGTTESGGTGGSCGVGGCGVVFKLDPSGNETVLHAFTGGADGRSPLAGLILDASGNLGGTTSFPGVVFWLDQAGKETVLHTFGSGTDGGVPEAGLVRDHAGNVYGTTVDGGTYFAGVVFKLSPR